MFKRHAGRVKKSWSSGTLGGCVENINDTLAVIFYGLDSNVTKLLANLLSKPSVFCQLYFCFDKN